MVVVGERQRQDVVALYLLGLGGIVVRRDFRLWAARLVQHRDKHLRTVFE